MDGAELRARRIALGLTQKQLAALVGVAHTFVSQMERGERPIPTRKRPLYRGDEKPDPSLRSDLAAELAMSDEELRDALREMGVERRPAGRGPYSG